MSIFRRPIMTLACAFIFTSVNAQKDSIAAHHQKDQVVTLTMSDTSSSFSITENSRRPKPGKSPRLEALSRKPLVFKINNINPLRYNIFLNGDLVTNFFDGATTATPNGITVNGAITVKEIPAINIFTFDIAPEINLEEKIAIREAKKEIETIKVAYYVALDTLQKIDREILALPQYYDFFYNKKTLTAKEKTPIEAKLNKRDKASLELLVIQKKLARKVYDLQVMLNTINDKDINILTDIREHPEFMNDSLLRESIIRNKTRISQMKEKLDLYNEIIQVVQSIDLEPISIGKNWSSENRKNYLTQNRPDDSNNGKNLINLLQKAGYIYEKVRTIFANYEKDDESAFLFTEEKLKIIEFAIDKKNKAIESCILTNSLEIGKLLEQKWTEYSRFRNQLLNQNSISSTDLKRVEIAQKDITLTFFYVKNWIADFALLNQSAKLDNKIFKSVHENIAANCQKLLAFLRDLDHINKSNTQERTIAVYDNLKNIDLIRFKIDKNDKVNSSRQTYEYDVWMKGGMKIDFSVGFFASGLTDRQYNKVAYYIPKVDSSDVGGTKVYTHTTIANTDSFYITESRNGNYSFCFGGMVNLVPRNGAKWMNIGGSLGVAYSTNQKLQALAAFSIHFGKTERLILHAGAAFGTIKQLDESRLTILQTPSAVKAPDRSWFVRGNINEFTIPDIERFAVKPFFGLSYNLSKSHPLNATKSQGGQQYFRSESQP